MMIALQQVETRGWSRALYFIILLGGGLLVFLPAFTFSGEMSPQSSLLLRGGTAVVFLGLTLFCRLHPRLEMVWQLPMTLLMAAASLLVTYLFSNWLLDLTGLTLNSPAGVAAAKLSDSLPIIVTIVIANKLFGFDLGSLYLRRGSLKSGLIIGLGSFAVLAVLALFQSWGQGVTLAKIVPVIPWILIFVLANGLMEELLFRGLFLQRYEPFLGRWLSVLVTAVVFTAIHMQVNYVEDIWQFLALVFLLALVWGWLMQKTNSLIGSMLFHAGADLLIIIGVFATMGTSFS